MTDTVHDSIYDYPVYYDLLFGSDWRAEFKFLEFCFATHGKRPIKRLFEPACGTGRLLIKLAKKGYEVGGNDLNEKAIEFCNDRLARHGFPRSTTVGDMADFRLKRKADAAFNTINSFRHLPTESAAAAHLKCMANAIAKGGLYMLGLHLLPKSGLTCENEAWSARRGNLVVNSYMWSKEINTRKRMEYLGMNIDVYTPTSHLRIADHMEYRTYSRRQFMKLLSGVPEFEVAATYDFAYDTSQQIEVDDTTEDVVFVLRRV